MKYFAETLRAAMLFSAAVVIITDIGTGIELARRDMYVALLYTANNMMMLAMWAPIAYVGAALLGWLQPSDYRHIDRFNMRLMRRAYGKRGRKRRS